MSRAIAKVCVYNTSWLDRTDAGTKNETMWNEMSSQTFGPEKDDELADEMFLLLRNYSKSVKTIMLVS